MVAAMRPETVRRQQPMQALPAYHCSCGRFLMRAKLEPGTVVELYCKTCKSHIVFVAPE